MTDDNSNLVDISDLDALSTAMSGDGNPEIAEAPEVVEEAPEPEEIEEDALATDEDTDADNESDEDPEPEEDSEEEAEDEADPEPEPKDKGKGKKSKYQERIDELTKARRETERQNADLIRRLEAIEAREREVLKKEPEQQHRPQGAPDPEAVQENGEPLYPLGKYDPDFIADMTQFTIDTKLAERDAKAEEEARTRQIQEAQAELKNSWSEKLDAAEEDIPEIREHIVDLVEEFRGLEPAYGEYIATTIMQADNGPAIMEYLSQNIGEAQKIVASGPAAATLAIGRLDAVLSKPVRSDEEEKRNEKRVSSAPNPPEQATKGRKGQKVVRGDTQDLSAFEREFYK
jgi:hypothetical protein